LKGTVVSFSQPEQIARVSTLLYPAAGKPSACARFPLHALQRLGSFLNCLSWKKSCSPAVKTKSSPQSTHFRLLSWNSMQCPFQPDTQITTHPSRLPLDNLSGTLPRVRSQSDLYRDQLLCSTPPRDQRGIQMRMTANKRITAQLRTVGWHETTLWPEIQEAAAFYAAASRFLQSLVLLFASLFPATLPS
jgi:hypothetical protein